MGKTYFDYSGQKKTYFDYRRQVYASINARKGNLMKLSKSKLIKKDELVKLHHIIDTLEELRLLMKSNGVYE